MINTIILSVLVWLLLDELKNRGISFKVILFAGLTLFFMYVVILGNLIIMGVIK